MEAAYIVLHSNLQRHDLSYSERAWAYRMERDLRARQGKRTDLEETSCNDCTKSDVLQEIGEKSNESRRTIAYLIRLTYLIPQLMELVDNSSMKVMVGVKLSYVPHELQQYIFNSIIPKYGIIKSYQAERIQNLLKENRLTLSEMLSVFEDKRERRATGKISFSRKKLAEFADILPDEESVERLFFEFLAQYREQTLKGA